MKNLDYLEGYPDLYLKEFIKVSFEDGNVVDALVYFKNEENNLYAVDYLNPMNEWI